MIINRQDIQQVIVEGIKIHASMRISDGEIYNFANEVEVRDYIDHAHRELVVGLVTTIAKTKSEVKTSSKSDTKETEFVPATGMDYFRLWLNTNYPWLLKKLRLTLVVEYRPMLITTINTTVTTIEHYCPHVKLNPGNCFTFLSQPQSNQRVEVSKF